LDEPEYKRSELDSRDLEILIDCLEAGKEVYVGDARNRIAKMIEIFSE